MDGGLYWVLVLEFVCIRGDGVGGQTHKTLSCYKQGSFIKSDLIIIINNGAKTYRYKSHSAEEQKKRKRTAKYILR